MPTPLIILFPLYCCRWFGGDIVDYAVDAFDLADYVVAHLGKKVVRKAEPVGGHGLVESDWPLTVYIRKTVEKMAAEIEEKGGNDLDFSAYSLRYAFIVCSIIPIIVIYPKLQKYFAAGVNVGGVKE